MEDEVNALCRQYTAAMHDIIRERFAGRVDFVPEIDRDRNWYALKVSQDVNVKEIAANMLMLSALMNRTPGLAAIEP